MERLLNIPEGRRTAALQVTRWQSPKGVTALHRVSGWAGELLNPSEKMLHSCCPREGSQASMAALNTSYSCTTASHKNQCRSPVTELSMCRSLGVGSAPSIKAWQGLHGRRTTQKPLENTDDCPSKLLNHTSFTPLHCKYNGMLSHTLKLVDFSSASKTYACTPNPISSH